MSTYKLTYFNGRGLAETSRLVLAATGTPYEDARLPFALVNGVYVMDEFKAIKSTLPMLQARRGAARTAQRGAWPGGTERGRRCRGGATS